MMILTICAALFSVTNFLITDHDFTNQIQDEIIYNLFETWTNTLLSAEDLILIIKTSREAGINPLVSLAKMQSETDVVLNRIPGREQWRRDRAMGYGMYLHYHTNGMKIYKYGGFSNQVINAIPRLRQLFDYYKPGQAKLLLCTDEFIIPENAATMALFRYTPFYGVHSRYGIEQAGNILFVMIFEEFKNDL